MSNAVAPTIPPAPVTEEVPVGNCTVVTDRKNEIVCNIPGYVEVFVRNAFGLFSVVICPGHFEKHKAFYEGKRREADTNAKI